MPIFRVYSLTWGSTTAYVLSIKLPMILVGYRLQSPPEQTSIVGATRHVAIACDAMARYAVGSLGADSHRFSKSTNDCWCMHIIGGRIGHSHERRRFGDPALLRQRGLQRRPELTEPCVR